MVPEAVPIWPHFAFYKPIDGAADLQLALTMQSFRSSHQYDAVTHPLTTE